MLFPDPYWRSDLVSGAAFLYFHDEGLMLPLHSSVSASAVGSNPFAFIEFVKERRPVWGQRFLELASLWFAFRRGLVEARKLIEPLHGHAFRTILVSYPHSRAAIDAGDSIVSASSLTEEQISRLVDPFTAADEIFAHLFLEKFLELVHPDATPEDFVHMGQDIAASSPSIGESTGPPVQWGPATPVDFDWQPLFEYCAGLFDAYPSNERLLSRAYLVRFQILQQLPEVVLTNPHMIDLLASLPVDPPAETDDPNRQFDTVGWEFFRQLVSPKSDPLDGERVRLLSELIEKRSDEVRRLKTKCLALGHELGGDPKLETMTDEVAMYIRLNVEKELAALFQLDRRAGEEFVTEVMSDRRVWAALIASVGTLASGDSTLAAGAGLYALSTVGSEAVRAVARRGRRLATSDYTLLYRMS